MREMRDSGLKLVGEIPKHWEVKRAKFVCDKLSKGYGITKEEVKVEGNIQCVRYGEIYTKYDGAFSQCKSATDIELISSPKQIFKGNLLFAGTGELVEEIGKNIVYMGDEPCLAGGDIIIMEHSQNPIFLNYALNSEYSQMQKSTGKAKLKVVHISATDIGNIFVVIPPISEQNEIADFLDAKCAEIDALTADIQTQIDTLEQYKRSVIAEAVTKGLNPNVEMKDSGTPWCPQIPAHWEYTNPKALFTQRKERAFPEDKQLTASQEYGIVYQDEFMELTGAKIVTVMKDFDILKHVEPNDFVISMRSFQGGLEYSDKKGCISSAYVMLMPNTEYVYPPFYRWFFKSSKYINAIQSTSNLVRDGQAMRYANFAQVPLFKIPIEEQKQIADYLDAKVGKIDEILKIKRNQTEILVEYKKSLIYEYVTGKKEVPTNA